MSSDTHEITAYAALAADAAEFTLVKQSRWLTRRAVRLRTWRKRSLSRRELAPLLGAVGLLVAANAAEPFSFAIP